MSVSWKVSGILKIALLRTFSGMFFWTGTIEERAVAFFVDFSDKENLTS